jgi:hypothetical protein
MSTSPSRLRLVPLLLLVAAGCTVARTVPVNADDATPPPATVLPTSPPTLTAVPTIVTQTPAPEPTFAPTPVREHATPIATAIAEPPTPTLVATIEPSLTPVVHVIRPRPTPTDLPVLGATTTIISAPWPSPAQLEQNARLRWGKGIPSSVRRWAFLIVPAARKYHLDPNLIAAVMTMESNGDPLAESPADARGLMQILHGPWDPRENVFTGARMLAELYDQFGDWSLTLAAYNAGPAAVTAYGGVPPLRETRDYVIIVTYLWDLYSHHHLSVHRRALYRSTLKDLQHFADQRKKINKLARAAHIPKLPFDPCAPRACTAADQTPLVQQSDPFWPAADVPDPLQHVDAPPGARPAHRPDQAVVIGDGEQ